MSYEYIIIKPKPQELHLILDENSETSLAIKRETKLAESAPMLKTVLEQIRDMSNIVRSFESVIEAERAMEAIKVEAKRALDKLK